MGVKETRVNVTFKILPSIQKTLKTKVENIKESQGQLVEKALNEMWFRPSTQILEQKLEDAQKIITLQKNEIDSYIRSGIKKIPRKRRISISLSDEEFNQINQASFEKNISKSTILREGIFGLKKSKVLGMFQRNEH